MNRRCVHVAAVVFALALGATARTAMAQSSAQTLRLPRLFTDGMVVQRGARIPVWGWAAPKTAVTARFRGRVAHATSDGAGRWSLAFPAAGAGGPYTLTVEAGGQRLTVGDVMVGDVWVASGQSNMEFPLSQAANAADAIASAHDSLIREFKVPISWAERPADDIAGGSWSPADPQHAGNFSAVAYFFARDLRGAQHVPIGILNSSWGGSAIETWLSAESQGMGVEGPGKAMAAERTRIDSVRAAMTARFGNLAHDPGLVNGNAVWAAPTSGDSGWSSIPVPGLWEEHGYADLDGIAWYRTTFTLAPDDTGRAVTLSLGMIDDDDITWVNSVEVGRTQGYNVPRRYPVPSSALRAGTNVIAVRVTDTGGGGGIYGAPEQLRLAIGGASRPLAGEWKFRIGEIGLQQMDGQRLNKIPAITWNKMVHPLLPIAIRGVIWYQGESNADNEAEAHAYREQFRTLITSWRREWNGGAEPRFPFLWVQLPNFGQPDAEPTAAGGAWAVQRESMAAALALPNTGQAVTIDVGEVNDIHPKDKLDVGKRLALVARRVAYGEHVLASGPTYRAHTIGGGRVTIQYANVGAGLVARGNEGSVGAFAIAGADRHFVRAQARVEGNHVVVWSDQVPKPAAVRYAWSNSPVDANLYNREGLPAAPFRTDRW